MSSGSVDLGSFPSSSSGGGVASVTASAPLASSGGANPNLTLTQATSLVDGYLSASDWTLFNSKQAAGNYITALTGDASASGPGSAALTLATVNANVGSFGSASSVSTFTVTGKGLITAAGSTSIQIAESQVTNLVNDLAGKQATGNYITALTGDVSASGPGSAAATLATVNSNVGSFSHPNVTVNGKGLITAISNGTIPYLLPRTTQSGTTYTLAASDNMSVVEFTGSAAATFSITAAATLGAGWWCYVVNSGTGVANAGLLTFDPNASETIDGATTIGTYPGDIRLITCNGTSFFTQLLQGGYVQYTAAGANTFTIPSKAKIFKVEVWGGGGGGGPGRRGAASSARTGGSGGGGGAYSVADIPVNFISGSTVTVTIAATAAGGVAGGDNGSGAQGSEGNNTTFGSLLTGFGGGRAQVGGIAASSGGGGGGSLSASVGSAGGGPVGTTSGGAFGGAVGTSNQNGGPNGLGGAAGGGGNSTTPANFQGGSAYRGGAGGGAGGYITAANVAAAGQKGGAGPGASSGNSASTAGSAGTTGVAGAAGGTATAGPSLLGPGDAGSGGGAGFDNTGGGTASAAGKGADGGIACGGGGGGASMNGQVAGDGGAGGSGLCRIYYS